jgi:large subunit ribosomal protein L4e
MSEGAEAGASKAPQEHPTPHHRAHVVGLDGKSSETLTLPLAFSEPLRPDLVRRAVVASRAARRQPHGTSRTAGRRHSVEWSGKGKGVSRTPRLMGANTGAQAPNTVGGGAAHPPRVATIWTKKINVKERRRAFAASLAATREAKLVRARGHAVPEELQLPVVVADPVEELTSSAAARAFLDKLELLPELARAHRTVNERARRGKRRGRRLQRARGILVVTSAPAKGLGFRNLPGIDVVPVARLSAEDLAPGGDAGRLTLFSKAAVEGLKSRLGEAAP